jgi:hypothetical protein
MIGIGPHVSSELIQALPRKPVPRWVKCGRDIKTVLMSA